MLVDKMWAAEAPADEIAAFEIKIASDDFECALTTTMPTRQRLETDVVEELMAKYPKWATQDETN